MPPGHDVLSDITCEPLAHGLLARARFAAEAFHPDLFATLGVPCPAQIRQAYPKRQADFLAGRALARAALARIGSAVAEIPIGPDRGPLWPRGVTGSISHSRADCMVLVSRGGHLCGVDCENIARGEALDAILSQCLSALERDWVTRKAGLPQDLAATLVYSAKETIFKALAPRVQRMFGFDCAEVLGWSQEGALRIRLTEDLSPEFCAGLVLDVNVSHQADLVSTWLLGSIPT